MIAFRPLTASIDLLTGVAAGFVEGQTAATTPTGLAYLTSPRSGSSSMIPTVLALSRRRSRSVPKVLRRFLVILSSTLPSPVSRTAISASSRARSGS